MDFKIVNLFALVYKDNYTNYFDFILLEHIIPF